jgi:MSHA pilin protein MshC
MFLRLPQSYVGYPAQPLRERSDSIRSQAGFTIVELVLVIVILAILGSVAGPRFFGNTEFSERAYRDELALTFRYAQKVAVASGCPVRTAANATGYTLNQQAMLNGHCDPADSSYSVPVWLADGQVAAGNSPAGISVGPALLLHYDALGRTDLASDQTLTVGSQTLTIQAASGLVLTP